MLYTIDGRSPDIAAGCFVAPSADIIGTVRLASGASVWFGCVLRGDNDWIVLNEGVNVQDGSIIHTDAGYPTELGRDVSVGHRVLLHNCTIGAESLIGNGALILDRVKVGSHCVIGAGTLIPPDKTIPDGVVVMGSPFQIVREVGEREMQLIRRTADSYRRKSQLYAQLQAAVPTKP